MMSRKKEGGIRELPATLPSVRKGKGGTAFRMIGWILVFACYFGCVRSYGNMGREEIVSLVFSDHEPSGSEAREILKAQEEAAREEAVCFYWEGSLVSVAEPAYGRSRKAFLAGILGEAALFDQRIRGFSDEDTKGCVIDRETALGLFGSGGAEGRTLQVGNEEYIVRMVIDWKERLILIHHADRNAAYSRAFFASGGGNPSGMAAQFLMRYGLSGEQADAGILRAATGICVWLLPEVLFFRLLYFTVQQKKEADSAKAKWLWQGACVVLTVTFLYAIFSGIHLPANWLPGKWSDFSFWSRRLSGEREKLVYFFMVARTARETELLYYGVCTVFQGILSVFLFLLL